MEKKDLKTGMYVKLRDGSICIVQKEQKLLVDVKNGEYATLRNYNDDLTVVGGVNSIDVVIVYKDYKMENVLWERPKELLTLEEKEYLKAVIKPLTCKVLYVMKLSWISIKLDDDDERISLAFTSNMTLKFEGLEKEKEYTLKELGLED